MPTGLLSRALLQVWRTTCRLLLRLLPPARHAVVAGWPDDEGNAVEVVRALRRRYRGTVYWLVDDIAYAGPTYAAAELSGDARVVRVAKASAMGVVRALTAETTFFTHGLYTAVPPPDDRLVVNLWHGDGPKLARDTHLIRSTVAVAGTALWGGQRTERFHLPAGSVAVVGNPRIEQFAVQPAAEVLTRLGLQANRRTVLWLPTYRAAAGPRGRAWSDADHLSGSQAVAALVAGMAQAARELDLQVVVKPHPLDADAYDGFDLPVLRHAQLEQAGVTLYQLLGAADAIVSDVSSVWVDYLVLDRPIAFYVPDLEELQRRRGLNVDDLASLLPGPRLHDVADARAFLGGVAGRLPISRPSDYPAYDEIGPVRAPGAADRLLDWLDDYQRARGRPVLFDTPAAGRATKDGT